MNFIDDEPRKHPKPMPFFENSLLQPTVPEVSLLMQENFEKHKEKKNDSFSGTEFQTYNSWRWKHMNLLNGSSSNSEPKILNKQSNAQECFLIKDKYFTSDVERRKNEILYGEVEEPRRPLPPRTSPIMPRSIESFFFNSSFDDFKPVHSIKETQHKTVSLDCLDKNLTSSHLNQNSFKKELDNSDKLYSIISEQNKQMQVLQSQIEQLLKLQEVKDKQIEQLLKSQESKEKKIEQLLQSLDFKDKEIEQLTNFKEKQEQHLQELLKSQENIQKENLKLLQKLSEIKKKDVHSIGVMAYVQVTEVSTCTSLDGIIRESNNKNSDNTLGEDISCIRDGSRFDERDKSLSLHSADLPVIQENAPSPQSSIHVDIQDFRDSSDESESEGGITGNRFSALNEAQSNPLGFTFYNNVLTQLQGIIQNSGEKETGCKKLNDQKQLMSKPSSECNFKVEHRNPVQPLQTWNVFEKENTPAVNKNNEERNGERFSKEFQNICIKESNSPSDISLKINALAMKYLKQEQITEFGVQTQPQIPTQCQRDVTIYNVTNLSFGSMRYLDRYQSLPKMKDSEKQMTNLPKNENTPAEFLRRKKRLTIEENLTSIGNILDITTLNQQPKLL